MQANLKKLHALDAHQFHSSPSTQIFRTVALLLAPLSHVPQVAMGESPAGKLPRGTLHFPVCSFFWICQHSEYIIKTDF